ncbi:MAG: homoserine dehydrogenase [Cytophagales bacterium]|jgi:homoserine dehydrogenase|nr:homoserine dehydrogenase [Cytophagales bacterium]MCA6386953.1 homoserine dehydrogenase [Cytophagales bacterium]MCA6392260.1 homoserine dehydrogenase [Cytophagales bacterium]MCA6394528.1 homoserine dehydrogenase [Cytophagales bacterium]MCA6399639.1 homoserine dehydrogenase [Cytophagales bacterium]
MKKKLKIGLFGFGVVGHGLYHVLNETHGVKAEIKRICVKNKNKQRDLDSAIFTYDKNDILFDSDIDIVVELIDDAAAAFAIVKSALENGKHVVTANKRMLAENLGEIYELQKKHDRSVLYEGSVCGSIPILRNLEEYYDNDLITSIEGIFNGSTNYILTKVFEERKSYADALKAAQELGFAESDPSLDVKGFDPKFKLTIAIAHTFGVFVKPENVINVGIDRISAVDLKYAKENNLTIKLVARAYKLEGQIVGFVAPQFIPADHMLASVRNEYNAVLVEGAFAEKQVFIGKGAGGYPTGSAVLSDISALTFDYRYEYKKFTQGEGFSFTNNAKVDVVISFQEKSAISPADFEIFKGGYQGNGHQYMTGSITLETLQSFSKRDDISVILAPQLNLVATDHKVASFALNV